LAVAKEVVSVYALVSLLEGWLAAQTAMETAPAMALEMGVGWVQLLEVGSAVALAMEWALE
jgi:hypothetical protein